MEAHSPQAQAILNLFHFDLLISFVIFCTVAGLVGWILYRFRQRPGHSLPAQDNGPIQDPGNPRLELLWTLGPALILLILLIATGYTMREVNPPPGHLQPDVIVIGHQWWWEYRYPKSGVVCANELHLPLGKKCLLEIRAADVIHNFWVPALGAKMDAIPGKRNFLWLEPASAGIFLGTCAEFCGAQHALMGIRVVVEPAAEFAAWEQTQLRAPSAVSAGPGQELFLSKTCMSCHQVMDTPAKGTSGPDLSHFGGRATLGSGMMPNTRENLQRWLLDPQALKPGCNMPNLHLTETQARALGSYLEALK